MHGFAGSNGFSCVVCFCCSSVLLLNFVCFRKKWFAVVPIVVVVAESVGL